MKKNYYIITDSEKKNFERNKTIRKDDGTLIGENFFEACEYDEQTNILGVNYVAYGIAKNRQWLNSPALPYIEAFTDKENLEIQQELQKLLCVSEMKRLIKAKQEIRFHNTEYGIEGAGKNIREANKLIFCKENVYAFLSGFQCFSAVSAIFVSLADKILRSTICLS